MKRKQLFSYLVTGTTQEEGKEKPFSLSVNALSTSDSKLRAGNQLRASLETGFTIIGSECQRVVSTPDGNGYHE